MISHYLFLLCTLYSFFNLFCAQSPHSLPLAFIIKIQNDYHPLSEGFDGSTLVKTPYGYSPIKDLKVGDSILDHNNESKKIIPQNIINIEKHLKNQKYPTKDFALKIKKILDKKQKEINKKAFIKAINKHLTIQNSLNQETKDQTTNDTITDAQAPGKPTENDGFIPAKNWDGQKVKNPHGGGYGWPDKNKNVWIPSGPKGHGGPHWDVQNPKTGDRDNIFPGGKKR